MIIVNTTFVLHHTVAADVKDWIKSSYLASAKMRGAADREPLFTKVLSRDTSDTVTYALHIYFPDMATAEKWNDGFGAGLRRVLADRWGERALTFHTYLEETE